MTLGLSPPQAWAKPTVATSHAVSTPQHDRSSSFVSFVTFCSNPPYSSPEIRLETPTTRPVLINVAREPDGTVSNEFPRWRSGSAGRNATLVTLSTRPVISAAVLLDLARWCQQRLAFTEDGTPCGDPQIDLKHPPFCASTHEGQETGHSQLATTGRLHAPRPSSAPGDDDRASRSKLARGRRKGGTR